MKVSNRVLPIILGFVLGIIITSIFYEYYIEEFYDSYLSNEYEELSYSSRDAFWDLDPQSSRFIQMNNLLVIHRASEENVISHDKYYQLAALFSTRACISYEDEKNLNMSEKMCKIAKDDYIQWNGDDNYQEYKESLIKEREGVRKTRESNNKLQPSAESAG